MQTSGPPPVPELEDVVLPPVPLDALDEVVAAVVVPPSLLVWVSSPPQATKRAATSNEEQTIADLKPIMARA